MQKTQLSSLALGLPLDPLPEHPGWDSSVPHAPPRNPQLSQKETILAIKNALRYFPEKHHEFLAKEFSEELEKYGHIYMYRFRPVHYEMKAYPISEYPAKIKQAAAIQLMIMNNLNKEVAQFPHELVTYGGNGSVFQNWAQFHLTMKYLSEIEEDQTLIINSGHPQGLFPSNTQGPRMVLSNGNMIPNYSTRPMYEKLFAMGNTMYGQMTAGSYCYIGSQGIVHGTTLTILNAGRKYLGLEDLRGKTYVTSGLGGMSGAQGKAGDICKCITVVAEVNEAALDKRHKQGWIKEKITDLEVLVERIKKARANNETTSIGFLGNAVLMWERLAKEPENIVDLASDQTSLHNPFFGGYYPVQLNLESANKMMRENPEEFKSLVYESLRRQVAAINKLTVRGMKFWDYGNSFLLESSRAGADVFDPEDNQKFRYPTYFEDMMDDIFGLGFGPFRWICTSGDPEDLRKTDKIAENILTDLLNQAPQELKPQFNDNIKWIQEAENNKLVVGSQARILYADTQARCQMALAFNEAINNGTISAPIVLSRDHHDVSGTDSPFRETSNIKDGSKFTADMAVQNVIGDSFRGATWVALHNGGGVGWGEVVNGGFGLVLDGSESSRNKAKSMLAWDVNNGVARRSWSGSKCAQFNARRQMELDPKTVITLPFEADEELICKLIKK